MKELIVISRLLEYPAADLVENRQEITAVIGQSSRLAVADIAQLQTFLDGLLTRDLLDIQADYSELFDRGRATSLLLFEHVHGESRDRGQAMVDLLDQYRRAGLELDTLELPDHLPVYLEYLAQLPEQDARSGLQDIAPILALLSARLHQRESQYAVLLDILLSLADSKLDSEQVQQQIADEARDDTPAALDAVWEEEQVKFFAEQGCGDSPVSAHQRRFAGAVAPQYLNLTDGGQR
ncbi:nitrate reductase molybdenum cofactor assembly chaperone [Shimwellia pseudoproteus]|uniref:nitrate reductase molybdenum cofactor assembly chaperone n=1 Tax=Shimwellia pseudoproteus TaxID=570012 RepID=UPI0018EDAE8A|nr:nitrate reductase molybdenum cofactor assembly chaperone [Shimwellia pseudoproteus]MBJ3815529.1 nitrate reductase molybdenum cofactor assembly chaperone [Shimwellia pseudoproteus]